MNELRVPHFFFFKLVSISPSFICKHFIFSFQSTQQINRNRFSRCRSNVLSIKSASDLIDSTAIQRIYAASRLTLISHQKFELFVDWRGTCGWKILNLKRKSASRLFQERSRSSQRSREIKNKTGKSLKTYLRSLAIVCLSATWHFTHICSHWFTEFCFVL